MVRGMFAKASMLPVCLRVSGEVYEESEVSSWEGWEGEGLDFYQGSQVREFPGKFFARGPGPSCGES